MDLRRLRHALVLQREGSFARASQRLHITQSALTKSVQALENEFGVKLFDRNTNGILPTGAGLQILEQARQLLLLAGSVEHNIERIRHAELGRVVFGVGPVLTEVLVPVLAHLCSHHPHFTVSVEVEPAYYLLERLLDEKIEFMFANASMLEVPAALTCSPVARLAMGYFVRAGHPLLGQRALSEMDLGPYPLVGPSYHERQGREREVSAGVLGTGLFAGRTSCENFQVMTAVALRSDAVLFTSQLAVAGELESGVLQQLVVSRDPVLSDIHLVRFTDRTLSPAAARVIELVEQSLQRSGC